MDWKSPKCPVCEDNGVKQISEEIDFIEDLLEKTYECDKCGHQFSLVFEFIKVKV